MLTWVINILWETGSFSGIWFNCYDNLTEQKKNGF